MAQTSHAQTFSSVERGFFFLSDYEGHYFPVRNSTADFILLNSHNAKDYSGVVSYLSADQAMIAQNCIEENMEKQGYDLHSPILLKFPLVAIPSGEIKKKWSENVVHEDQNVVIPAGGYHWFEPIRNDAMFTRLLISSSCTGDNTIRFNSEWNMGKGEKPFLETSFIACGQNVDFNLINPPQSKYQNIMVFNHSNKPVVLEKVKISQRGIIP